MDGNFISHLKYLSVTYLVTPGCSRIILLFLFCGVAVNQLVHASCRLCLSSLQFPASTGRQIVYFSCIFQVKSCVTAFHVTCGFKHGLEMRTVLDDAASDGVRHIVSISLAHIDSFSGSNRACNHHSKLRGHVLLLIIYTISLYMFCISVMNVVCGI